MNNSLRVSDVRLTPALARDAQSGLLGFVACVLGGRIKLDGLVLRRTTSGRLSISFPERRDAGGRSHPYIRPLDDQTRRELERQILEAIAGEVSR